MLPCYQVKLNIDRFYENCFFTNIRKFSTSFFCGRNSSWLLVHTSKKSCSFIFFKISSLNFQLTAEQELSIYSAVFHAQDFLNAELCSSQKITSSKTAANIFQREICFPESNNRVSCFEYHPNVCTEF